MIFNFITAGESHGKKLTLIVTGVPAGMQFDLALLDRDLASRQIGYGRGGRMKIEKDRSEVTAGVRSGLTTGAPIAIEIENKDWKNWKEVMAVAGPGVGKRVTVPRPGHADLAGLQKFGLEDIRDVIERASARETAARVAAGAVAKMILSHFEIFSASHVFRIGKVAFKPSQNLRLRRLLSAEKSELRCINREAEAQMKKEIDKAASKGDSLGGQFEILIFGVPPGLGSYTDWRERIDGAYARAIISVPGIKGVEFGEGFLLAKMPGSRAHDQIFSSSKKGIIRSSNHAGGIEGGVTNGERIRIRAAMKPIPTLKKPLRSIDIETGKSVAAHKERSDVCAVPSASLVCEAMACIVTADALMRKFGGDNISDSKRAFETYLERLL